MSKKQRGWEDRLREKYADEIEKQFHKVWKTDYGSANVENYFIDTLIKELKTQRKQLVEEIEEMGNVWDDRPPEPGLENSGDPSEMYQCGYFDAIEIIKKLINEKS